MKKIMLALGQFSKFSINDPEQQQAYLFRMLNKCVPESGQISQEGFLALISEGKEAGFIQNGAPCLSFGPRAMEFFFPEVKKTIVREVRRAIPDAISEDKLTFIAPESHHNILQALQERRITYRVAQVLAELELRGGELTAKAPHVEIAKSIESIVDNSVFVKALPRMAEQRLICIEQRHKDMYRVALTPEGEALIATLKMHPEYIGKEPVGKLNMGTSFKIIEHILDDVTYNEYHGSEWLKHAGYDLPIIEEIVAGVGKSYDALVRRVYDLQAVKKYLEIQKSTNLEHNCEEITNVRVTAKGVAYYQQVVERNRQREGVLDENEVWEAEQALERCVRMAGGLGDDQLAQELLARRDAKHFFEMSKSEFDQEVSYLQKLQERLLEAYAVPELPGPAPIAEDELSLTR